MICSAVETQVSLFYLMCVYHVWTKPFHWFIMSYNGTENFKPCCNYSSLEWKCYWSCNFSSLDEVDGAVFDYNYYLWIAEKRVHWSSIILFSWFSFFRVFSLEVLGFFFLVVQMCNSSWMFIYFQLCWQLCWFCWLSSTYLMPANS